jgi:hypothetical protein
MNLLTVVPLYDNRGNIRYHLGTQVDISGLVKECAGLRSLEDLVVQSMQMMSYDDTTDDLGEQKGSQSSKDALGGLSRAFTLSELKIIQTPSGDPGGVGSHFGDTSNSTSSSGQDNDVNNKRQQQQPPPAGAEDKTNLKMANATISSDNNNNINFCSPSLSAPSVPASASASASISMSSSCHSKTIPCSARVQGILEHYLLVRPYPSLRVLFASPSLRVPGILQSSLLSRIGGSTSDREVIAEEFRAGRGVTAKIRWLARPVANLDLNPNPDSRSYDTHTPSDARSQSQSRHSRPATNTNNKGRARTPSHRSTTVNQTPPGPGSGPSPRGRSRWIHTTPLLGVNGAVGVWMIILVDDETADKGNGNDREKEKTVVPPVQPSTSTMRGRAKEKGKEKWPLPRMPFDGTVATGDITTSEEDVGSNSLASQSHHNPDLIPEMSGAEAAASDNAEEVDSA